MVAYADGKPCSGLKNYFYWGGRDGSIDAILGIQHKDLSSVPRIQVKIRHRRETKTDSWGSLTIERS